MYGYYYSVIFQFFLFSGILLSYLQCLKSERADDWPFFHDRLFYCFTVKGKGEPLKSKENSSPEEKFVFRSRKSEETIDHLYGTRNYSKTIYFVKHNHHRLAKVIPNLLTFHALGLNEETDLTLEVSEADFQKNYLNRVEILPPFRSTGVDSFDDLLDQEMFKSLILQGIILSNFTYLGEYINPSLLPINNRLLLATGLNWNDRDNHPSNYNIEFRWFNHSLAPISHYSNQKNPYPIDPDPNPSDTYYLGIREQHVAALGDRILTGEDPRMLAINDHEFYVVYTNRFYNPKTMGAALIRFNETRKEWQILTSHQVIHDFGGKNRQKNWTPFLLVKDPLQQSLSSRKANSPHQLTSQGSPVEYHPDLYLIQQIHPLTVYRVTYEDMQNPSLDRASLPFELISRDDRDLEIHWSHRYGEFRGGTNAVYLSKYNCYLSIFHSATFLPGIGSKTYVFGAYTFTATPPFRFLSYTMYPIMARRLYTGPWNPIRNWNINYVAFPMSLLLFHEETEILLSLGHQDSRGYSVTTTVAEIMENMIFVKGKNLTNHS